MTKVLKSLSSAISSPFFVGVVFSIALSLAATIYYNFHQNPDFLAENPLMGEINRLHNLTIDFRLRQRGPRKGSDDVAILTIDEKAVEKYGRWPWSRDVIAKVITEVIDGGAKSVAFDIIFSEPQDSQLKSIDKVGETLTSKFPEQKSNISSIILKEKQSQDHDGYLSQVIEKYSDNLILGAIYQEITSPLRPYQDSCFFNIRAKEGAQEYWEENEEIPIGVHDKSEFTLPSPWNNLIKDHLNKVDQNVAYKWLQENKSHDIALYFTNNDIKLNSQKTINLFTHFIQNQKTKYQEALKSFAPNTHSKLQWSLLEKKIPPKTVINLRHKMKIENDSYCFRYLTPEDELASTFKSNWVNIVGDSPLFKDKTYEEAAQYIKSNTDFYTVSQAESWLFNIPRIRENTIHTGAFNANQDPDGSIRRTKLFVRMGKLFTPSLALKTYLVSTGYNATIKMIPHPIEDRAKVASTIEITDNDDNKILDIPTDYIGQLPINYAGPQKMFSYLSAGELLDDTDTVIIEQRKQTASGSWEVVSSKVNKKDYLKGKHFIFGATATGIYDLRVTPFEEDYPGVETHANVLDNLLRKDYLRTSRDEPTYMPLAILILGVLFSFIVAKFGAILGISITLVTLFSIYFIDAFYIFSQGIVLAVMFPILTVLSLYTFLTFFKYFTEERKKKELKGTFQKYVSPEIVNEILKDPSKLELGGIKQEMSVFFSDIRGFTTISEKLDPKALSDLLNHYLTPMTAIIFENSGTLDKYMGDAIMAFFGAPVYSDKHASQACRAALLQIEKLFELQKIYEEQGLPMIDIGIGINTGDMSVGNMGSETVRNYTVMGDAVNLGARLEGINKQYGTRIIISEFTQKQIDKDNFVYREIDWVRVKGKNEPVRIFELIGEGTPEQAISDRLKHFNKGFSLYHDKKWEEAIVEFNQALDIDASDRTSQLYVERCQDYIKTPPADNWDGVFVMTTK